MAINRLYSVGFAVLTEDDAEPTDAQVLTALFERLTEIVTEPHPAAAVGEGDDPFEDDGPVTPEGVGQAFGGLFRAVAGPENQDGPAGSPVPWEPPTSRRLARTDDPGDQDDQKGDRGDRSVYEVWIEIEEETPEGEYIDHSFAVDGASAGQFDTLEEAVEFANRLQRMAGESS